MPKSDKYVPTHRAPGKHKAVRAPRRALRTGVVLTGLAAAVTGVSVTGGLAASDPDVLTPAAADVATATPSPSADATTEAAGSTRGRDHARALRRGRSSRARHDAPTRPRPRRSRCPAARP